MLYTFTTFHGKQLTSCSNGNLYNDNAHIGIGDSDKYFTIEDAEDGKCYIKTKYGYVKTDRSSKMTCNASKGDEGTLWRCVKVKDGVIAFQGAFGKWFSPQPKGGVVCNGPRQSTWEMLRIGFDAYQQHTMKEMEKMQKRISQLEAENDELKNGKG